MASSKLDEKQHLETARTEIESSSLVRSKADKIAIDADFILNPSSDWKKLKSFSRVSFRNQGHDLLSRDSLKNQNTS